MAGCDPALGTHNTWRGDPVEAGPTPTLYHSEGSYYSQLARLALVEKGAPWRSRLMDLHTQLEQARSRAPAAPNHPAPRQRRSASAALPPASRAGV